MNFIIFGVVVCACASKIEAIEKQIQDAEIVPYQASVSIQIDWQKVSQLPMEAARTGWDRVKFCSGAILSKYWILTAASCLITNPRTTFNVIYVKVGSEIFKNVSSASSYEAGFHIDKQFKHENQEENNIGLLKLKQPIAFDEHQKPVKLAKEPSNSDLVISNFGIHLYANDTLLQYDLIDSDGFKSEMVALVNQKPNENGRGFYVDSKNCIYEEGAPAIADGTVFGIASSNSGCRISFSRVDVYSKWINEIISAN